MDRKWMLGEDLSFEDNMLDGITFREIVTTVHCNCQVVTADAVRKEVLALVEMRLDDMKCIMEKNMDGIIEEAMKGRA